MRTFTLEIKTPQKRLFLDRAARLTAQAVDGEIGIMAGHAALATRLKAAPIRIILETGETKKIETGEGFLIVSKDNVSVLLKK
jgi:F-type H+-transporting ATPase subunit epsilon